MKFKSDKQIEQAKHFIDNFMTVNREKLVSEGISAQEIYPEYVAAVQFPLGQPAFFPVVKEMGLTKIRDGLKFKYVLFL